MLPLRESRIKGKLSNFKHYYCSLKREEHITVIRKLDYLNLVITCMDGLPSLMKNDRNNHLSYK